MSVSQKVGNNLDFLIIPSQIKIDTSLRKAAILGFPITNSRGVKQSHALVDGLLDFIQNLQTA